MKNATVWYPSKGDQDANPSESIMLINEDDKVLVNEEGKALVTQPATITDKPSTEWEE